MTTVAAPAKAKKTKRPAPPRVYAYSVTQREAAEAASRLRNTPEGERYVIRFDVGQRIQHVLLLVSFSGLGVTGLAQTFSTNPIGAFVLTLFGGIDSARAVHHIMAFLFIALSIYHVVLFIEQRFIHQRVSRMFPDYNDFRHLVQILRYNLGLGGKFPRFDRFTFEEKAEYWALIWGGVVMTITGIMQWYPVLVTNVLPGWAIPVARAFHKWEAILAVLAIITWHMYHVQIKTRNFSIFTGKMSFLEMEEEHPLELAYLEAAAGTLGSPSWRNTIHIVAEEGDPIPEPEVLAAPEADASTLSVDAKESHVD